MAIQPISNASVVPSEVIHGQKTAVTAEFAVAIRSVTAPTEAKTAVQQPSGIPNMAELERAVDDIRNAVQTQSQGLEFSIDSDSHRTIVKVIDQQTKEVIRQIPSEEALQISKALDQAAGLLIRQKA